MEEFQRCLGAPTEEHARERVGRRPLQDVRDFRPESLLLDPVLQRVDPGNDEAVELLVAYVSERAVEFANVIGRRVAGAPTSRKAAHVGIGRNETEAHLQHRVAEPERELPLGRDLVRHQVDNGDLQRTDVLPFGSAAVDRQRAAERRQEGMDFLAIDEDGHFGRSLFALLLGAEGARRQVSIRLDLAIFAN